MAHPADLSTPSQTSPAARSPRRPGRRVRCSRDRPAPTGARRARRPRAVARGPAGPGAASQWWADGRGAPAGTDDRRGRPGAGAEVRVRTDAPRVVFGGFPRPGHRGYFDRGSVRIQTGAGGRSLHRADARHAFSTVRHKLSWDALDALYFAGCAVELCVRPPHADPARSRPARGRAVPRGRAGLAAAPGELPRGHPDALPSADVLLRRYWPVAPLDYTAEVFSRWARARNYCSGYREMSAIMAPTRRRVTLRGRGATPNCGGGFARAWYLNRTRAPAARGSGAGFRLCGIGRWPGARTRRGSRWSTRPFARASGRRGRLG